MATQLPPIYVDEDPQAPSMAAPTAPPDDGVSLSNPVQAPPSLPDDVATTRAVKIQDGIGEHIQKSTEDIKAEIQAGREDLMRKTAASNLNVQKQQQKLKMLTDLANSKGGPLDENEIATVLDPFNPNNKPVDPDSVVEKQYATKFIGGIQDAIDNVKSQPLQDAQDEIPQQVQAAQDKGSELSARMEYSRKLRENWEAAVNQQSWPGYIADTAKNMFQPYVEYKMRGNTEGVGDVSGGILLGSNLQEQADHIFRLPFDEFTKQAKQVTDYLGKDNPQLAIRFSQYLEGLPTSDKVLDNAFTVMAVPDYLAGGKVGLALARKVSLNNRANTAVRQLVQAADKIQVDQAAKAEAAGDLSTAGTQRASDNIIQDINGQRDPIALTKEPLLTSLNMDKDNLAKDKGNLSTEQLRRIQDQYDASGKTLLQRIIDSVRINRTPMAVTVRNAVDVIKESVKDYYPGARNAILDVSDPLYEPRSNTYWHDVTFGNFDGTLFSNPETAENFAKLHGWDDVKVTEGQGPITRPQIQKLLDRRIQVNRNITDAESAIETNRARSKDSNLSETERQTAKEQYEGLLGHRKIFEKEAEDIELRLKGNETYDRVANLQQQVDRIKQETKTSRDRLKKDKTMSSDDRGAIEAMMRSDARMAAQHVQEINAIKSGKAEVTAARDTTVQQHGVGFKIVLRRPLVETDRAVRDLLIRDVNGVLYPEATSIGSKTGLKSMFNAALGTLRTSEDTLALNESINRKIGTYTQSLFKEWASQEAKYIRQIASGVIRNDPVTGQKIPYWRAKPGAVWDKLTGETKKTFNEFSRTLDYARDAKDPVTGKPGYFFSTPGELNQHYLTNFNRSPSYAEHEAYFAFVRMVEGDRVMRELAEFRNRARLGIEQFSVSSRSGKGEAVKSEFFDGRSLKKFPGGDEVMMIMGKRFGQEKIVNLGGAGIAPKQLEDFRKAVEEGRMRVIEIYAPEYRPLRSFSDIAGNEHIRYVLTDSAESKPIEFNHVNRRGGGHFEYDYDHFLKQANMYHQYDNINGVRGRFKSVYTGDTTFMPVLNRVMGRDIANHLHEVQRLLRDGDVTGARRYTQAHMPIEWDKLYAMFKPGRDELGKQTPAMLDLHEPFVVVPKGKSVLDMDKGLEARYGTSFKDSAKSGSLNKQFQVAYNTERESSGLTHWEDVGSQGNPLYQYAPTGKMIDPITTMNKALNRIVNSVFMDDYKMYAVEHWLREASTHLKASDSELRASPFWHFQQADDKSFFKGGTSPDIIRNLLSNRFKINQFVGIPNATDTAIHTAKQWLVDTAYQKYGPEDSRNILQKAVTIAPDWALSHIRDPITFIRSMTFHAKLGIFNPAQFLVQSQTYATILAVSPFHGISGTYATLLHGWASLNRSPEILRALDNYATKLNVFGQSKWRPGEFTEAMQTLDRTGFNTVAGEYSNLNTALKTDFVGNDMKSILNAGTIFFRGGEKSTRLGAWYTAFREFREVNPTGPLSRTDIGSILQRADLLTVNMSRASNAYLNKGVFSLTTQFINYQLRLAELFMGTRLGDTPLQRMMARGRLVTFYSLLYGAPSAIGLTGLPLQNAIRSEATQRGYTMGDNWLSTAIDQGLLAMAAAWITGKGDWKKGNNYNIGDRLGSPGFTQISDALKSDHAWWQLLAGASGTTLLDTLTASNNFFHWMGQMFSSNKDKAFPLKIDDFTDVLKTISSVNQGWKLYAAINTGKWISKNEGYVGDVSKWNAAFMAITGLNPAQQDNEFIKAGIRKDDENYQKYIMRETIKEMRRGYVDQQAKNQQSAIDHFRRADTLMEVGGFPAERKASVMSMAAKGYESMIDSADYQYATKNVPESRSDFMGIPTPFTTQSNIPDTRREQFRTQLQLNQLKGQ